MSGRVRAALNPLFQVGLDVMGRTCLVIGGDGQAVERASRLLDAGARVVVVSPEVIEPLGGWAAAGRLELRRRRFESADLEGASLVVNTSNADPELSAAVFRAGQERGILVNTFDEPALSHFGMAALVAAGHLRIAISTSNASPSLSRRLREDLERLFDAEFADYLGALARVRAFLRETEPDFDERRRLLGALVAEARLEGAFHLPAGWRQRVEQILGQPPRAG